MTHASMMAFMGLPGGLEWVVIGLVGLLVFGRRLPSAARSVGASIVEFKRGLNSTLQEAALEETRAAIKQVANPEG